MRHSEGNILGEVKGGIIDREAEYSILKQTVTKESETYCRLNVSLRKREQCLQFEPHHVIYF